MFSLRTDVSELPTPGSGIMKKSFNKVQMTVNNTGAEFKSGTTCEFKFQNSSNDWYSPAESFAVVHLTLCKSDGTVINNDITADKRGADNVALAFDAPACLFSSASHLINDTLVSKSDNYAQASALANRMTTSDSGRKTSGEASTCLTEWEDRFALTQKNTTHAIIHRPVALAITRCTDLIPPSTRHLLTFDIASNWQTRCVDCKGADKVYYDSVNPATTNAQAAGGRLAGGGLPNEYFVKVERMEWYACMYQGDSTGVANATHNLDLRELSLVQHNLLATQEDIAYTIPPASYRIGIAHADVVSRTGAGGRAPPTIFKSRSTGPAPEPIFDEATRLTQVPAVLEPLALTHQLSRLYFNYGGLNYPPQEYQIDFVSGEKALGLERVYHDTVSSLGFPAGVESWEKMNKHWGPNGSLGQISFQTVLGPTDQRSTDLMVSSTWKADPTGVVQWLVTESLATVALTYNSASDCSNVVRSAR
jgi:hypothetical protein